MRQFHISEPPAPHFCDSFTRWSLQPLNFATVSHFGAKRPKNNVLSSILGSGGPKMFYCRQLLARPGGGGGRGQTDRTDRTKQRTSKTPLRRYSDLWSSPEPKVDDSTTFWGHPNPKLTTVQHFWATRAQQLTTIQHFGASRIQS